MKKIWSSKKDKVNACSHAVPLSWHPFMVAFLVRCLKGQNHEDFARVWPHWKANSHINIYESLKILVIFLFRHHTNSLKLLLSVFGHGWPRWKWITIWKRLADDFKFCACILQKSLKPYYGLLSLQKFTWYLPLDVPGAFCVWGKALNLNFSEVLTKREQNPRDTAPLRTFCV